MRIALVAAAVLAAWIAVPDPAARADDGAEEAPRRARALHDVRIRLSRPRQTIGGLRVTVTLANRGRSSEQGVEMAIWSDADPANALWTGAADVRRGHRRRFVLVLQAPEGTTRLTATCALPGDSGSDGSGGGGSGDDGSGDDVVVPVPPTGTKAPNELGAEIWLPNCSGCHGETGRGGTVEDVIAGHSAGDIYEAVREGEGGMPRFPGITWTDAQNIAAYLRDPVIPAPTPTPDPTPDPGTGGGTTTPPTYTGQIAPLLSANCTVCHTGTGASGGVRLDTYTAASNNASKALTAMQAGRMPPAGPLSAGQIALLADWIAAGKPK